MIVMSSFFTCLFIFIDNHSAAETEMMFFVVYNAILPGGYTLYFIFRFNTVKVADTADASGSKFRGMANLECDFFFTGKFTPRIFRNKIEAVQVDYFPVLGFRVIAIGNVDDIPFDIFLNDEPRSSAESEPFSLPDGMEPVTIMFA